MAGNFGFSGLIGLSGLDFFVSFWGNAKKKNNMNFPLSSISESCSLEKAIYYHTP